MKLRPLYCLFLGISCVATLSACTPSPPGQAETTVDQASLCVVGDIQRKTLEDACKPGQKVAFLPSRWGSEQLPVIFAAFHCDLNHGVVSTNGGVTCIYRPVDPLREETQDSKKPQENTP